MELTRQMLDPPPPPHQKKKNEIKQKSFNSQKCMVLRRFTLFGVLPFAVPLPLDVVFGLVFASAYKCKIGKLNHVFIIKNNNTALTI